MYLFVLFFDHQSGHQPFCCLRFVVLVDEELVLFGIVTISGLAVLAQSQSPIALDLHAHTLHVLLVLLVASLEHPDEHIDEQVLEHEQDGTAHDVIHQADREPDVRRVIVGPEEARIGRVRPHDKRDLHEPRALREEKQNARERRPERVLHVHLERTGEERQHDQDCPEFVDLGKNQTNINKLLNN